MCCNARASLSAVTTGPTAALAASRVGRLQPGIGALTDEVAPKGRERATQVEHERAAGRGGVHALGQAQEADAIRLQLPHRLGEVPSCSPPRAESSRSAPSPTAVGPDGRAEEYTPADGHPFLAGSTTAAV